MTKQDQSAMQPTRVRHAVVAVAALMSVLLYLDRFCISFAEIFIKEDLGVSDVQIGWVMSAFFFSYALAQVPSGWFSDRFGVRPMLTIYILAWSAFTALTGVVQDIGVISGFLMLIGVRLLFGVAQAGAYPTSASMLSKWAPFNARGISSSIIALGGRVGGTVAPFVTGLLIVALVPPTIESQLSPDDLMSPAALVEKSTDDVETDPEKPWIPVVQKRVRDVLQTTASDASAITTDRRQLADLLNSKLIASGDLYDAQLFAASALEKEGKRIGAKPAAERSPEQQQRLNRLILEMVYRDEIRKVYGQGWRQIMFIYGAVGLLVAGLFWMVLRNRPQEHPHVNDAEVQLIEEGRPTGAPSAHGKAGAVPLVPLVTSVSMWLVCVSQFCTNIGWVFIVTWLPRYLQSVHEIPVSQRGLMCAIPPFIGWAGMFAGGVVTDRLVKVVGLRWGRSLPMSLSRFTAMAAYLYCVAFEPNAWVAVAMFGMVSFSTNLGTAPVWAFKQDVGGRYVGSILGWGNMWGNLGASVTPPLLIWIVGSETNWNGAFLTCAAAFFIAGIASLGVDATKPIAPD